MLRFSRRSSRSPEEISLHTEAAGSAPPDAFGPFRVLHQIGAGVLGPVFRAYDPGQDKLVAVKLFRLDLPPERVHELVADFERLIAADLTHSSIVAAIGTGMVQVSAYLAQDFVAADSLDTVLREHGPAPSSEGLRIITQIAGGLDYAAVVGVVHGALHPRDVLISPDDVRITGVGVARALERVGVQVPVRRPYAAPERVEGGAWDRRADVFTLAALAHEMLWGRRVSAIGAEAAAALDELPGAALNRLRETFARALAENPAQRYPSALEFADALKGCFTDRRTRVRLRLNARPRIGEKPRRRCPSTREAPPWRRPLRSCRSKGRRRRPSGPQRNVSLKSLNRLIGLIRLIRFLTFLKLITLARPIRNEAFREDLTLRSSVAAPDNDAAPAMLLTAGPAPASEPPDTSIELGGDDARPDTEVRVEPPVRFEHPVSFGSPESFNPARSAVWPLSLALLVGVALGFAGGYWLGQSVERGGLMDAAGSTTSETEVRLKTDATAGVRGTLPGGESAAAPPAAATSAPPRSASAPALAEPPPVEPAPAAPRARRRHPRRPYRSPSTLMLSRARAASRSGRRRRVRGSRSTAAMSARPRSRFPI